MRLCSQCCAPWRSPWHRHTRAWHLPEQIEAPTQIHCWLQHLTSRVWEWRHHNILRSVQLLALLPKQIWQHQSELILLVMQSQSISIQLLPEKYSAVTKWYNLTTRRGARQVRLIHHGFNHWFNFVVEVPGFYDWLQQKSYQLSNKFHISLSLSLSL